MIRRVRALLLCAPIALLCAGPLAATEVEAERLDGRRVRGDLLAVTPDLVLRAADGDQHLPWAELLSVQPLVSAGAATQPTSHPLAAKPGSLRFSLADGSQFTARLTEAAAGDFAATLSDGQECRLELSMLRAIAARDTDPTARARLDELLRSTDTASDAAIVARGAEALTLRGSVKHIDTQRVLFNWNDRDVPLPWASVVGVVFAHPAARGASSIVRTRDGEAFAGRVAEGTPERITLQSATFEGLTLPWSRIERIDCRSQKLIFLSDLTPARYDFEPFFDKTWNFALDRTLSGRPIRLGNREYPRGVTMHSKATLAYRLGSEYRQFVATAGICDELGSRGAALLRVLGDERVLWEAHVRGGQPPQDVLVNVSGVDELSLQVDYDDALDLGDHACWAFARLIK